MQVTVHASISCDHRDTTTQRQVLGPGGDQQFPRYRYAGKLLRSVHGSSLDTARVGVAQRDPKANRCYRVSCVRRRAQVTALLTDLLEARLPASNNFAALVCCSPSGLKDIVRVLFTNTQGTKQYGPPRPPSETIKLISAQSEEHRQKRRVWLANIAQVLKAANFSLTGCFKSRCRSHVELTGVAYRAGVYSRHG